MKQCFFAVDLGATSGRTILGTFTSNGLEMEEVNRFPNHLIEAGRHFYWDIYELYRHIIEGLRIAARKGVEITSIGIDTWGVDFVCVDIDGRIIIKKIYAPEEDVEKLCSAMTKFYLSFKPSNVNSYAESLKDFMVAAIKLYK